MVQPGSSLELDAGSGLPMPGRRPFAAAIRWKPFGTAARATRGAALQPVLLALPALLAIVLGGSKLAAETAVPTSRVQIRLSVRGELFAPAGTNAPPVREPITLEAGFDFLEAGDNAAVTRHYREASAAVTIAEHTDRTSLASDARDVEFTLVGTTPTPHLADGFLSRQEAELLEIPFDPLLLDRLLPATEQAGADSWKVPGDVVAGLLAIDTVTGGGIDVTVEHGTDGAKTLRLTGTVHGAVDGAATRIDVTGAARLAGTADDPVALVDSDQARGRIEGLEVTLAERREAGWLAPGLDVEAALVITRSAPLADTAAVSDNAVSEPATPLADPVAGRPRGAGRPGTVWHRHPHGRYTLVLDRRWRVVEDGPEGLVMRLADHGALVAQCSIMPLPRSAPDAAPSPQQVSRDVERSLAGQFGHLAAAEETTRDDGTRVVRVVAEGSAEGRPFRWIHHLLADPAGHRAAVTCMLEPALADRFGGADHELVAGIVLLADPARPQPAAAGAQPVARQAQLPENPGAARASP